MVSIDLHLHKLRYPQIVKMIRYKSRIMLTNFKPPTIDNKDSLDEACNQLNT